MNQGWTYHDQVDRSGAGLTLLDFYVQRYRHSSRAEWQERIEIGQVRVAGQHRSPQTVLEPGQRLTYHRPPWQEPDVPLSFDVLYQDADLLIINKPSGLPVLPGGGFLEHTLLYQLQKRFPQETPRPIHRLGRGTSGVMLVARSQQARAHLSQQMRDRQIHKVYRALIGPEQVAAPLSDQFEITDAIGKVAYPGLGYVYAATPSGRTAHSLCQVLQRRTDSTLLSVTILTGRPHQIRIHLAAVGYPLIGDPLYVAGGQPRSSTVDSLSVPGDCGYCLHAYSLQFVHPRTGLKLQQVSPPPMKLKR
ncbi:RluA family pseudouridine synthase [Acaryochloris sp. IP29b_bin.148]|uniref:RluA family pseudouridine synthase n=1 Tax=Acaryochloris sp. IP29b_bin.148 TaxID=2969218 RepID=UPI0026340DFB|nr:RluA family pseudouridine synthase [Acaryochloris sp. IP29b_bin.148]